MADSPEELLRLHSFWDWYASLSEAQRLCASGPVLNKIGDFLLRPAVRRVVSKPRSTVSPRRIMDGGGVLLLNLSKGRRSGNGSTPGAHMGAAMGAPMGTHMGASETPPKRPGSGYGNGGPESPNGMDSTRDDEEYR